MQIIQPFLAADLTDQLPSTNNGEFDNQHVNSTLLKDNRNAY